MVNYAQHIHAWMLGTVSTIYHSNTVHMYDKHVPLIHACMVIDITDFVNMKLQFYLILNLGKHIQMFKWKKLTFEDYVSIFSCAIMTNVRLTYLHIYEWKVMSWWQSGYACACGPNDERPESRLESIAHLYISISSHTQHLKII